MHVEFEKTIRGVEVTVHADNFDSDPSVGIGLGPDELWAETDAGAEFALTDEEVDQLSIEATDRYEGIMAYDD